MPRPWPIHPTRREDLGPDGLRPAIHAPTPLLGVYDFSVGKFVLEKLLRWTDHVEQKRAGGITLLFDAEDKRRL